MKHLPNLINYLDPTAIKEILLAKDKDGMPALHLAMSSGNHQAVETYMKFLPKLINSLNYDEVREILSAKNQNGESALHVAMSNGNHQCVEMYQKHLPAIYFAETARDLRERKRLIQEITNDSQRNYLVDLFSDGERNLEQKYISKWKETVNNDNVETVIISMGSADSTQHQSPDFTKQLGKTAILDINPGFMSKEGLENQQENVRINYMPSQIEKTSPKFFKELNNAISEFTQSGKKVILICNNSPVYHRGALELVNDNVDELGKSFCFIESGHKNQSVRVYSKKSFTNTQKDQLKESQSFKNLESINPKTLFPDREKEILKTHIKYWEKGVEQKVISKERARRNIQTLHGWVQEIDEAQKNTSSTENSPKLR